MNRERIKTVVAAVLAALAVGLLASHYLDVSVGWRGGGAQDQRDQPDAILAELKAIRALLEKQGTAGSVPPTQPRRPVPSVPAQNLTVSIDGSPSMGDANAPLVMVEFTDYQCPFCGRFHEQTFPEIRKNFIDKGLVLYVVRDLPLRFHPHAEQAALAARCAAEQGDYWAMWDVLFANGKALEAENLPGYANSAGLDGEKLHRCMESGRHLEAIRASVADANRLGITGTPSFVIGRLTEDGTVQGAKLVGAKPYGDFEEAISAAQLARGN